MTRARRMRGRRGATAVEFAVVGSVFLMMLLLAIETAYQFAIGAALDYGARDAARFGATGQTTDSTRPEQRLDDIIARVLNKTRPLLTFEGLSVVAESFASPPGNPTGGFGPITAGQQGALGDPGNAFAIVRYRIRYEQRLLTPFARMLLGRDSLEHSTIVIVKNEPFVQGVGQ